MTTNINDTIIVVDSSLSGNKIITNTEGQLTAWELAGYLLEKVEVSECKSEGEPLTNETHKIVEQLENDSLFKVKFNAWELCGSNFLTDVDIVNENTLNLIYIPYNSWESCRCNYQIEFVFKLIDDGGQPFPYQIKFLSINGERKVRLK